MYSDSSMESFCCLLYLIDLSLLLLTHQCGPPEWWYSTYNLLLRHLRTVGPSFPGIPITRDTVPAIGQTFRYHLPVTRFILIPMPMTSHLFQSRIDLRLGDCTSTTARLRERTAFAPWLRSWESY